MAPRPLQKLYNWSSFRFIKPLKGITRQRNLRKLAILGRKPGSHVRITGQRSSVLLTTSIPKLIISPPDKQRNKQTNKYKAGRQVDRQVDRQTDRHRQVD